MVDRDGAKVPAHYGSPAGELAVCVRMVGLADRSDLGKLVMTGRAAGVTEIVRQVTGVSLPVAGVAASAGTWWCAASPGQVMALCEPGRRARLLDVLRPQVRRLPGVEVADGTTLWAAIALVGPRMTTVLSQLGALGSDGDPRWARPFDSARIAGADVHLLLQSDRRALLLVESAAADHVWRTIENVGRPLGLSCVGTEAVERFSLLDRMSLCGLQAAARW